MKHVEHMLYQDFEAQKDRRIASLLDDPGHFDEFQSEADDVLLFF